MDYNEKRTYMRMQTDTPAKITLQPTLQTFDCICKDLTAKGMMIETEKQLLINSKLIISIPASSSNFSALKASITVLRCDRANDGRFLVGSKIDHILPTEPELEV